MRKFYKILALILVFTFISAAPAKAAKTEKKDRARSTLIEKMEEVDYVANSITYERGRASKKNINEEFKKDGISRYTGGPTFTEYRKIMNYKWTDTTQYDKKPVDIASVDVGKRINYSRFIQI